MFGWFACYCHAFHPSQDIAVFAVFEFVDLQMKAPHSAFHRTVITSKLCILSSLLTILSFCYFSYCSDGFSSIWCCLLSFVLHFVQKVEHMGCTYLDGCASMCAINCDKPCNQNCIVNTIAIIVFGNGNTNQLSYGFIGVLLVMLSSFWKCNRLCLSQVIKPCHPPHMSSDFILLTMSVIRQFSGVNLFVFVDIKTLW